MDNLDKLISALKGSLPGALAICVASGLMLFGPKVVTDALRVEKLPLVDWLGSVFAVSAFLSFFLLWERATKAIVRSRTTRRNDQIRKRVIADLTTQEREALIPFVLQNLSTISYDKEQVGVFIGLHQKGIIYFSGYGVRDGYNYNITPWAWKLMTENPLFIAELEDLAKELGWLEESRD